MYHVVIHWFCFIGATMEYYLFEYNFFEILNVGYGVGLVVFGILGFISSLLDTENDVEIQLEKGTVGYWFVKFFMAIGVSILSVICYVILKFLGFGVWQLLLIIWDYLIHPFFSSLFDLIGWIFSSIYNYKGKEV